MKYLNNTKEELYSLLGNEPLKLSLGYPEMIRFIPSYQGIEGFWRFPGKIVYPPELIEALIIILNEYTNSFDKMIRVKQGNDYYQPASFNGKFVNFGFQIDMRALPPDFLEEAKKMPPLELASFLKKVIYEIENSLAMYSLMRGLFGNFKEYSSKTFLGINFNTALELWKNYHEKKLVLGAVTIEKFESMLMWEFGISPENFGRLSLEELRKRVKLLSGFDDFYGPVQLGRVNLEDVILYMRTSYPISWLKKPEEISIPLLQDPEKLALIRNRAITFNVDNPKEVNFLLTLQNLEIVFDKGNGFGLIITDAQKRHLENLGLLHRVIKDIFYPTIINDTKEALVLMGIAFPLTRCEDINLNNPLFREFLESRGENPDNPTMRLRIKPAWLHYGGYGHKRGRWNEQEFRRRLKKSLQTRGPYVVQPEIPPLIFKNESNKIEYAANDQMFFLYDPLVGEYKFAGGQRISLPVESEEARRGRIHGNRQTVWAEIVTTDKNLLVDQQSLNYVNINRNLRT